MKKLLLALCLLIVAGTLTHAVLKLLKTHRTTTLQKTILCTLRDSSPENTIVAFDVHQVIVNAQFKDIRKLIWVESSKLQLLEMLINPFLLSSIISMYRSSSGVEPFLKELSKKYPHLSWVSTLYFKAFNCQTLNLPLLEYLKKLKDAGYALYVFSNIESEALANLRAKFPVLDVLFDGFFIPGYAGTYHYKPDTAFYEEFKRYIIQRRQRPTSIILVDNFPANIQAAYQAGLYGLLFTSVDSMKCVLDNILMHPKKLRKAVIENI